jgi:CRISPR type III-A-associated RAMP protein Csm4
MNSALLIRLRPVGPWRYGPGEGGLDRVDTLYRSDRLFSAVTLALERLGLLDEWLDATARAPRSAVAFSSLFPFQGDTLFVPPPATLWPPPVAALRIASLGFAAKVRWKAAQFVPVTLVESLLMGQRILAEQWIPDAESGCLLRRDRPQSSPFRVVSRRQVAVDRLGAGVDSHSVACVEFEPSAGLWAIAEFTSEQSEEKWGQPLRSAFQLLADTGFGARRSSGWGQTGFPDFQQGQWPAILLPKLARTLGPANDGSEGNGAPPQHWLLSLFSPADGDAVDWSGGSYSITLRGGRVESRAGSGKEKKLARMVTEGCVIASEARPAGSAVNVAPDDFPHPVYRSGLAFSLQLPAINFVAAPEEPAPVSEGIPPELIPAAVTEAMIAEDDAAKEVSAQATEDVLLAEPEPEAAIAEDKTIEPVDVAAELPAAIDLEESPASGIGTGNEAEQAATPDPVPPFVAENPPVEPAEDPASEPSTETETLEGPAPDDAEDKHEV